MTPLRIRSRARRRTRKAVGAAAARLPSALAQLHPRWQFAPHNLLAHPLSEVLYQLGFEHEGNRIHDVTLPVHEPGTGRG